MLRKIAITLRNALLAFLGFGLANLAIYHVLEMSSPPSICVLLIPPFSIGLATWIEESRKASNSPHSREKIVRVGPIPINIEDEESEEDHSNDSHNHNQGHNHVDSNR